jgi:glycosyltransferase involved in cell wall biosynthesis
MKINYYFRSVENGSYSIENVFFPIIDSFSENCITKKIYAKTRPIDIRFLMDIKFLESDIHHITGDIHYASLVLPSSKTILTIHDLGHLLHDLQGIRKSVYKLLFWDIPVRKVRFITTISEFTKDQLLKHFNLPPNKVRVIPNPVHPSFLPRPKNGHDTPVILQIGRTPNKNIECLISAVAGLDCKLLLIRPPELRIEKLLLDNSIRYEFRYNLDLADVNKAYVESDIIFFASTYEGFGLPIVEGMAIGRPVITSKLSPMEEIAGGAATLVNPNDSDAVRKYIQEIWKSPDFYSELVEKGRKNVQRFARSTVVEQYRDLYQQI